MSKTPPLPAFAADFLATFPANSSTGKTYEYALRRLAGFMIETRYASPRSTLRWRDDLLAKVYKWLLDKDYAAPTRVTHMAAVKRYLMWLDANDYLPDHFRLEKAVNRWIVARGSNYGSRASVRQPDPGVPRIVMYYDQQPLPPPGTPEHRLERLKVLRARAVVHTLYASAGRVSEVASLTRETVLDGRLSEFRIIGKGRKERVMLLTPQARQAIAAYCEERGKDPYPGLFISHGRGVGKPLGRGTLWAIVKAAAEAVGLHKSASPHSFRHYRAQQLLDDGMSIEVLQAFLGHTSIDLTRRVYAPNTPLKKIRDQFERFGKDPDEAATSSA